MLALQLRNRSGGDASNAELSVMDGFSGGREISDFPGRITVAYIKK